MRYYGAAADTADAQNGPESRELGEVRILPMHIILAAILALHSFSFRQQ